MYYDTPVVGRYITAIKKYRIYFILASFILAFVAFWSINPQLFSTDERVWLQDSLEL
jgi:hypothetical protein